MNRRTLVLSALALAAGAPAILARAADAGEQPIFGRQIMSPEERDTYRAKLRDAASADEREQIRREHHDQMVVRAKERGMTLPSEPPSARGTAGAGRATGQRARTPGKAPGPGAGPGQRTPHPGKRSSNGATRRATSR